MAMCARVIMTNIVLSSTIVPHIWNSWLLYCSEYVCDPASFLDFTLLQFFLFIKLYWVKSSFNTVQRISSSKQKNSISLRPAGVNRPDWPYSCWLRRQHLFISWHYHCCHHQFAARARWLGATMWHRRNEGLWLSCPWYVRVSQPFKTRVFQCLCQTRKKWNVNI